MTKPQDILTFDDLSENYSTWIIKYYSTTFDSPLFLVWYTDTDENRTDRLLTFKSGKIFAVKTLIDLKTTLQSEINNILIFDNLNPWLDNFKDIQTIEFYSYDLISVTSNIGKII